MKLILDNILSESEKYINDGVVASYIPELAKANKDALGVCVMMYTSTYLRIKCVKC